MYGCSKAHSCFAHNWGYIVNINNNFNCNFYVLLFTDFVDTVCNIYRILCGTYSMEL